MPRHKSFAHEDPFELVKRIPVGSRFVRNGTTRYWFARTPFGPGMKSRRLYVGSDANKAIVERAWAIVGAELAELEATPEVRKLRALSGPALARTDVVEVPILESPQQVLRFAAAAGRAGPRRPKE